jgi:histidine triad (HIT) family protein
MYDENCIFCKIVQKQAPSSVIYETPNVLAFLDIRPLTMGHTLVIQKPHYQDIFDIPQPLLLEVHKITQHIAPAIKKATGADGVSIIQQNGKAAGQDIFHLHVHVVPRFEGQKLPRFSDLQMVERIKLDAMAEEIKRCLES